MLRAQAGILLILVPLAALAQRAPARLPANGAGAANDWSAPRTPWGDPDLQGVWNNSTITELERPASHSGKQVLGDDEAVALEQRTAQHHVDRPPAAGDQGTYNQF